MMDTSPFMTPDQSRRRRDAARRRRRQRRTVTVGVLALAIAAGLVVMALAKTHSAHSSAHDSASASPRRAARPNRRSADRASTGVATAPGAASAASIGEPPTHSQTGLPLSKPPLTLTDIGDPGRDSVHIAFVTPPSAGLLFNLDTGQVLWQRNPFLRLHMASLTKMMTALLTVQSAAPDAPVLITREAVNMAGSKVGVLPLGRHVRLETLLYGLLLPSGNDAADALARYVAGSVNRFVVHMNAEAAQLGMGCTRYSSPSGYYDRGNYTCVADLAELAHADLDQPRIASIARAYSAKLPLPIKGGHVYLYNNNPLLIYGYPGLTGLKTGYTIAAGKCLVATAERDGVRLGVVLLNSPDPGTQAAYLLNRGFEGVYHQRPVPEPPIPAGI